jgi:hypothetical protein
MSWFVPLLLVLQPPPSYPGDEVGSWTCQKQIEGPGGTLWVRRILDPEGKLALEDLAWHGQREGLPTTMKWRLGPGDTRVPYEFSAFVTWSRVPRRPVRLVVAADGRVEERPFVTSADLPMFRRDGALPLQIWYSLDSPVDGPVPSLYGVRQLTMRAVEEGGATVGSAKLSLPDWDWLEREAASARARLAAQAPESSADCYRAEPPVVEPEELIGE